MNMARTASTGLLKTLPSMSRYIINIAEKSRDINCHLQELTLLTSTDYHLQVLTITYKYYFHLQVLTITYKY